MKALCLILCLALSGCAGYAHWQDYKQTKKLKEIEQRIEALEKKC